MNLIMIIEDDMGISLVLKAYLTNAGFEVVHAINGEQALELFSQQEPSLVLLDVMLPGKDGWSILQEIRERSACPVIMITALSDVKNRLFGFEHGADDYITKPFVGEEVVARVKAVLRRIPLVTEDDIAIFGSLKLDYRSRSVKLQGRPVLLTPRDLALLFFLAKHPNQAFDRKQLLDHVWGMDYDGSDRAVDLSIKRIRKTLADWPEHEGYIETLRGWGYKFHVGTKA